MRGNENNGVSVISQGNGAAKISSAAKTYGSAGNVNEINVERNIGGEEMAYQRMAQQLWREMAGGIISINISQRSAL